MENIKIEDVIKKEKKIRKITYICIDCGKEDNYIKVFNKTSKCTGCGKVNLMAKL